MDVLASEVQAERLIRQYFPLVDRYLAVETIRDFARIAYFLEQPNEVLVEFRKLEEVLQERFRQKHGNYNPDPKVYMRPDMTKGILTSYLNEWDRSFGFNTLSNETQKTFPIDFQREQVSITTQRGSVSPTSMEGVRDLLPTGRTPTITGFASPTLFRIGLLRLGYHWKDPGAGPVHGDITHRLQWFAITSAYQRLGIRVAPLYLFQKLASPETWNPEFHAPYSTGSAGRALWDFLCDCFTEAQPDPVGPTSAPESYRSPVNMQRDLTSVCPNSDQVPLLRRIISRKKFAMRAKEEALQRRESVAIVDYEGPNKTTEMVGKVAFYRGRN